MYKLLTNIIFHEFSTNQGLTFIRRGEMREETTLNKGDLMYLNVAIV